MKWESDICEFNGARVANLGIIYIYKIDTIGVIFMWWVIDPLYGNTTMVEIIFLIFEVIYNQVLMHGDKE
jgi:hypothetical protein